MLMKLYKNNLINFGILLRENTILLKNRISHIIVQILLIKSRELEWTLKYDTNLEFSYHLAERKLW